jgi:uncharacterized membrane protein
MSYTKTTLIIVGLIVLLMGIWGAAAGSAGWSGVVDPLWHAALKIIVGLVAIAVGYMDKKQ